VENTIPRAVPHLLYSGAAGDTRIILSDRHEASAAEFSQFTILHERLRDCLQITERADLLDASEMMSVVEGQYAVSLEYIFSHPIWSDIRSVNDRGLACTYAYLLETRHYLAAAASRMAPSILAGMRLDRLTALVSEHLLEEYDHADYYEASLAAIGVPRTISTDARPLPSTTEWIHFTRAIARTSPFTAALCSGLMEASGSERDAVRGWHAHLQQSGLLSEEAVNAIFKHVEVDLAHGHDSNWRTAIECAAPMTSAKLCESLNCVASLADMLYRWFESLREGMAGVYVGLSDGAGGPGADSARDGYFDGLPVWPARVLGYVNGSLHGLSEGASKCLAVAYFQGPASELTWSDSSGEESLSLSQRANQLRDTLAPIGRTHGNVAADAWSAVESWVRSVEDHPLWEEMQERPSMSLLQGFVLENYHYIQSAARHIAPAVASCNDPDVRLQLVLHLKEETGHGAGIRAVISNGGFPSGFPDIARPLPTTTAFVGYLADLATTDWVAYILASGFIQATMTTCRAGNRDVAFYGRVTSAFPEASSLLRGLQLHDQEDTALGHDAKAKERINALYRGSVPSRRSFERASVIAQLTWGFYDGILQHYSLGPSSVVQRIGWH